MMMMNDMTYDADSNNVREKLDSYSIYKEKNCNNLLNMENLNTQLRIIEVRIEFIQIGEVDTMNEKFQAIVKTKSKWYENEVITEYNPREHWNPKLFIENALHDKFQEEISYTIQRCEDKTLITETRISKGVFWERMELPDFPLDIQEISVTLSTKHKPSVCKLISDTQKISTITAEALNTFRDQQKFKLYRLVKTSETASYDIDSSLSVSITSEDFKQISMTKSNKRSKFVASCYCSRKPGYYITNVYSFNFLITVLSLTLFVIDTKLAQNRISGTFTLILTSFSFKVVTSKTLPTISYLTSLDKYQIINIVYLAMCCVWHSVCASLNIEHEKKFLLDKIVLCCFASFFTLIQLVFVVSFIRSYQNIKALKKLEEKFTAQLDPFNLEEYDDD